LAALYLKHLQRYMAISKRRSLVVYNRTVGAIEAMASFWACFATSS